MNKSEAALTGAILGGMIDGSSGDDSVVDGVIIGALVGSSFGSNNEKLSECEQKQYRQFVLNLYLAVFLMAMVMFSSAVFMNGSALSALEQFITKGPLNKAPLEDVMSLGVVTAAISFGFFIIRIMLKND